MTQKKFFLGCAVWAFKPWVGEFYPPKSPPSEFLSLYSRRFTTVEGNTTFYATPKPETVTKWAIQTSPGFQFCLKLPRNITHNGLLKPFIPDALDFLKKMQPLGDRLGVFFAQLPPSYGPSSIDDLTEFLQAWPRDGMPLALEVRHPDWFEDYQAQQLNSLLKQLGVGKVLLDSRPVYTGKDNPQLRSQNRKPNLPLQFKVTAPFTIVRFISHPQLSVNQIFFTEWVTQIEQWLRQDITTYFFIHCPEEERSPSTARYFQQLLETAKIPIPSLPWNLLNQSPTQLSLW
ncbi:MAG: DUF72 domain-containing protein [Okeania sp. SIO2C9]|uniref:DUF72 domain-containing protein n=1 Tax=Okeania sp. SIO2C9 TaxID=2607791 RepID=UPI0013BFC2D8|nr:DUF72 domain-containing protein [Okeania sp. SIO2C9]NEQ73806.1 DUF72 domain-containing protein [Okeania sp. SIO2C9]